MNRIQDVYFDYDKHAIRPDAQKALEADAKTLRDILKQYPNYKLTVEGFCDERGSEEYNLALGDARAKKAKEFLVTLGLPCSQLVPLALVRKSRSAPTTTKRAGKKIAARTLRRSRLVKVIYGDKRQTVAMFAWHCGSPTGRPGSGPLRHVALGFKCISKWILDQKGDQLHVQEVTGNKVETDFTCSLLGTECVAKKGGHSEKISMYFNGAKPSKSVSAVKARSSNG